MDALVAKEGKGQTHGRMVDRKRDRYAFRHRMLRHVQERHATISMQAPLRVCTELGPGGGKGGGGRTMVTSSPLTVTSGLLKCRRAVMAAIDAQSSMLPSSSRKWTSTRNDQTWKGWGRKRGQHEVPAKDEGRPHFLSGDDAERFPVYCVASPERLFQKPRHEHLVFAGSA